MRGIRKWLVPFLVVASIGLVTAATDSGAVDLPPDTPANADYFTSEEPGCSASNLTAGPIVNRRPSNTSFLATGAGVSLVEDTLNATRGYDDHFLTQPEEASTQTVRRIVQIPPADAAGETVATAAGFFSSFESPDLVVLRGDSRLERGLRSQQHRPDDESHMVRTAIRCLQHPEGVRPVRREGPARRRGDRQRHLGRRLGPERAGQRGRAGHDPWCLRVRSEGLPVVRRLLPHGQEGSRSAADRRLARWHDRACRPAQPGGAGPGAIEAFGEEYDGVNTADGANGTNVLDMFGVLLSRPVTGQPGKRLL